MIEIAKPDGDWIMDKLDILVLGASYGLLPAVRLGLGGHRVTVLCRAYEQEAIAKLGATVQLTRRDGNPGQIMRMAAAEGRAVRSGELGLVGPDVIAAGFDLIILAMGEPQYAAPELAAFMNSIAKADVPILSLMNLLPSSFLQRFQTVDVEALKPAYSSWDVWQAFDPARVTAASPDAQAVRTDPQRPEHLTVTLASNFKVAPFERPADQSILDIIATSSERLAADQPLLPARVVAHGSLAVPLSKWPMLIAGNCRCLREDGTVVSIGAAVHDDLEASQRIYDSVVRIVTDIGGTDIDVVPFKSYAAATNHLTKPSSLARALMSGASAVERVDLMVLLSARMRGIEAAEVAQISSIIQKRLDLNTPRRA